MSEEGNVNTTEKDPPIPSTDDNAGDNADAKFNPFPPTEEPQPGTSDEQIGMNTMNRLPTERGPRTAETSFFPQEDQAWAFVESLNPNITSLDLEVLTDPNSGRIKVTIPGPGK